MKINKKFSCFICLLLSVLMLLPMFASCNPSGNEEGTTAGDQQTTENPTGDETHKDGEGAGETPADSGLTVKMLSQMKIVYAHGSPETITKKADELKALIQSTYGVELVVSSDYLREGSAIYCELPNEILIGETARDEDDVYYSSLGYEDYGYTIADGKIIIGGGNESATVKAVNEFAYDIVLQKKGGDQMFFCSDYKMEYKHNYVASEIKLNGATIKDFQIVYPADGVLYEKQLATYLASNLQYLTGYRVPVVSDETDYADGYEILVGKTNRNGADSLYTTNTEGMNGCIAGSGKFIALYGASAVGNSVAATGLISRIKAGVSGEEKKVDLTISNAEMLQKSGTISNMTYNVYAGDITAQRVERVSEMIIRYMPDVFGVQEANTTWMQKFNEIFSDYYDTVGNGRDGGSAGEHCAIFYSKERFELLETGTKWLSDTPDKVSSVPGSGWIRILTYAKLKDRITDETIVFVNTHLDFGEARDQQVKILFNLLRECGLEDYPVVLTGDMNSRINSGTIKSILSVGFTSANSIAQVVEGLPAIDFIMVTNDCINVSFARVCDETICGGVPSDHPATYAEFTVSMPEGGIDHDFSAPLPSFPEGWLEAERDENDSFGDLNRIPGFAPSSEDESE